ncbi:hypothetical protein AAFF_G00439930 [Aldrovandia affinis]|uniref:Uncharacterized protein n=1 Tax=Aldrovandia affinis TaxID=143900 RepID=A0AAD7VXM2_9TELE|nr:hypothetical protein AAFF_G00439930 [Aldrovandia affinis]
MLTHFGKIRSEQASSNSRENRAKKVYHKSKENCCCFWTCCISEMMALALADANAPSLALALRTTSSATSALSTSSSQQASQACPTCNQVPSINHLVLSGIIPEGPAPCGTTCPVLECWFVQERSGRGGGVAAGISQEKSLLFVRTDPDDTRTGSAAPPTDIVPARIYQVTGQ